MGIRSFAALFVAVATIGVSSAAMADETGFASSHTWRKERGLTCMADHWHYGSSNAKPTKAAAQKDAISSWASFTDFEYGSDWARWSKAGSKKMDCKQGSSGWECSVEARACR